MIEWQLGIQGARGVFDTLAPLLEAREAIIESGPDDALLVASFTDAPDLIIMDAVGAWLANLGVRDAEVQTRRSEAAPWQPGWRAIFSSYQVSPRIWVTPVWEAPVAHQDSERVDVVIDPTKAFGAGAHPTTFATLRMLDSCMAARSGDEAPSVLDVGSGTGILAIAAAHLGATATGVEIDPLACRDSEKNAALNGIEDRFQVIEGSMERVTGQYDIVLANIYGSVLVKLADAIKRACKQDLILSGMYTDVVADIIAAYGDATLVEQIDDRGWTTLHLRV